MVIVFLPALDGLRPQWREAAETLGGTTWEYWRHVAGPILAPSFLGALLLLFANAFSRLRHRGGAGQPGLTDRPAADRRRPQPARSLLGQENVGKAMALGMVVIVAVVMTLYAAARSGGRRDGWADEPAGVTTAPPGPAPARRAWGSSVVFFLLPLVAMLEFTTRAPGGGRSLDTWATLLDVGAIERDYPELIDRPDRLCRAGRAHRRRRCCCCSCRR